MARSRPTQLNIRSDFARERAYEIAERTGMTTVQVVEEALRAYTPPPPAHSAPPHGLIDKGGLLVKPAGNRRRISLAETLAAIEADRLERGS